MYDFDRLIFQHQEKMLDECPKCDICGKDRFMISVERVTANHNTIATTPIYKLCKGPKSCRYHCTCHLEIPSKLGVTEVLHVYYNT